MSVHYTIRVRGIVDRRWETRLGGMRVTVAGLDDASYESILTGELPDQAALNGVLSALYGLGYRLVSVQSHS